MLTVSSQMPQNVGSSDRPQIAPNALALVMICVFLEALRIDSQASQLWFVYYFSTIFVVFSIIFIEQVKNVSIGKDYICKVYKKSQSMNKS